MNDNIILTKRVGKINPLSIEDYINLGGYNGLKKVMTINKEDVINEIKKSGLSGRGGANFPTGLKIENVFKETEPIKYVVCNADEGEPGNFKDKYLMENDPHQLIEGIIILGYLINATKGYIYVREEYNKAQDILREAISKAKEKGFLGDNILNSNFNFEIEVFSGAGSYLCGEEYALISSIEGNRGKARIKPPFPTNKGLFGKPTLLSNVETMSNIAFISENGGEAFAKIGTSSSKGTRLISLSGNVKNKGVFEVPLGTSIKSIISDLGQTPDNVKMIQLGGPSGPIIPNSMLDLKLDYEELKSNKLSMGSGAIIVMDNNVDLFEVLKNNIKFFNYESCGKCTPCREGLPQVLILLQKFIDKTATSEDLELLEKLATVIAGVSFCGLGQASVTSISSSLKYFKEEYEARIIKEAN